MVVQSHGWTRSVTTVLFFWLILTTNTFGQTIKRPTGINFLEGNFQRILAKAKASRKPVFIDVYLTGCPHCEALVPILAEKKVGDFFNANFVNWKIEANSDASKKLQRDKGVTYPEFPLFLFLDTNGTLVHMATPGERSSKADFMQVVIQHGEDALNPKQRTASYGARFQAGDRDLGFLLNFGKYCKVTKDTARLRHVNDALGQVLVQPQDRLSQAGFYAVQRLIDDVDNPLALYFFSHLPAFTATYLEKVVKEAGEGLLFRALYGSKSNLYSAARIVQMRDHMVALGVPVSEAAARTLLNELDAHLRERNTVAATQRFNEYRKQVPTVSLADYAYLMHYFNEKAADTSYLAQMPIWAADGLALAAPDQRKGQQAADLYYELAVAYQKMGNKAEALRNAQQGLNIAKEANIDTKRYENIR